MSLKYIRDAYGVPAKKGARVVFTEEGFYQGKEGVITAAQGAHLLVRFGRERRSVPCHPKAVSYVTPKVTSDE